MNTFYSAVLLAAICVGLVPAVGFLVMHRPTRWWRSLSLVITALPLFGTVAYARSLGNVIMHWPATPRGVGDVVFSLSMLALMDAVLIMQLVSFWRFGRRVRSGEIAPCPICGALVPPEDRPPPASPAPPAPTPAPPQPDGGQHRMPWRNPDPKEDHHA